jgi:hypothetical protein
MQVPVCEQQQEQQQQVQRLIRHKCSIAPPSGAPQLSVLTFNVLADGLAQGGGFVRVPEVLHDDLAMC